MSTRPVQYEAPTSLEGAIAALAHPGAALLGGGTDLVPAMQYGVARPQRLVSLRAVPGYRDIAPGPSGALRIGAFTTLREVAASPLVRAACPALAQAAGQAGSPLLRNRGTLGGNLCLDTRCWYYNQSESWRASRPACQKAGGELCHVNPRENRCVALFAADTPPALVAGGARLTLRGPRGERSLDVEALYTADALAPLAKDPAEVVTLVELPPRPGRSASAYLKWRVRESIDFPVLGAAAFVRLGSGGRIAEARIALTGVTSAPLRLRGIESGLAGQAAPDEGDAGLAKRVAGSLGLLYLAEAVPHKRRIAGVMVTGALARAAAAARGEEVRA